MTKREIGPTLEIARKLVGHLPKEIDQALKILIKQSDEGQDTTLEIIDLLWQYESIRLWMMEQINIQGGAIRTRGYESLAGNPRSIRASKNWICPKETCVESLPVIEEVEDAPTCRLHGIAMVRTDSRKR